VEGVVTKAVVAAAVEAKRMRVIGSFMLDSSSFFFLNVVLSIFLVGVVVVVVGGSLTSSTAACQMTCPHKTITLKRFGLMRTKTFFKIWKT
jgi:hypothetical protein